MASKSSEARINPPEKSFNEFRLFVLASLAEEPRTIGGIRRRVNELAERNVRRGWGNIYVEMGRYENWGLVEKTQRVGKNQFYGITDHGIEVLADYHTRWNAMGFALGSVAPRLRR